MKITRRRFLGTAGAAAAAPYLIVRDGRTAADERVTFGLIGCGGRGRGDMNAFLKMNECQVLAVCDVDDRNRERTKASVEKHYAGKAKGGSYKGCDAYRDYRELCGRKDIDAVIVGTPDHWHALNALAALRNGKDVYCEKPVVHLFAEGRVLCNTVKEKKAIWQTGSQQRSTGNFRQAVELVLNGVIGKVKHVEVGLPRGRLGHKKGAKAEPQDPPSHLDYDLWCGPSRKLPFIPARLHFNWRWNLAYGGGQLMDWIGHHNDIAHWGLGEDESGPVEVEAAGFRYPKDKTVYDAPFDYEVRCAYASGITTSISSQNRMGTKWIGEDGWVYVNRGKLEVSNKEWIKKGFNPGEKKAYNSGNHHRNFFDCVKSRKPAICTAEISFRSISPGLLGYVSDAVGRKLRWDPKSETVVGDEEADKLLKKVEYREPWKLT